MPFTPWKAELRTLAKLALPVVLAELGWMLQGVVDVVMVGKLGPSAIAAVALGNALYYPIALFAFGLLLGLDTVVSQAFGRGDRDACPRALGQGVYIAFAATVPAMLATLLPAMLLPRFGVEAVLIPPARSYLLVLMWGTLPLLLYGATRRYLQAIGEVRVITLTFLVSNLVNWGANEVLIYGKLGLPAMGPRGSALATVISRVGMAVLLLAYAAWHERQRHYALWRRWPAPAWAELRGLLRLGLPAALHLLVEVAAFETATILAARISVVSLAAHQIALNYAALAFMVPLGISAAASISVGHAIGAGDPAKARRAGWLSLGLAVAFMLCSASTFVAVPRTLIALYTRDPGVVSIGVTLLALALAAVFAVFDAVQVVVTGALRGMGLTRVPMLVNFAGYWLLGLPIGILLAFPLRHGVAGLWTGLSAALVAVALVLFSYWRRRSRPESVRALNTAPLL
ncbi:MAG: MATE family efflux transporter [Janthinobacterium lividum]